MIRRNRAGATYVSRPTNTREYSVRPKFYIHSKYAIRIVRASQIMSYEHKRNSGERAQLHIPTTSNQYSKTSWNSDPRIPKLGSGWVAWAELCVTDQLNGELHFFLWLSLTVYSIPTQREFVIDVTVAKKLACLIFDPSNSNKKQINTTESRERAPRIIYGFSWESENSSALNKALSNSFKKGFRVAAGTLQHAHSTMRFWACQREANS